MIRLRCAVVFILFIFSLFGQEPRRRERAPRPKVGVALAGGSAMGLSHLGVLKWLEEHRIPVDYIAGTSMGSLVGGLYASGRTPAEMMEYVEGIDWNFVLAPTPPFRQLAYRRKEDAREYPSSIELGYKKGIKLPTGLSSGHGVGLVLSRFTAPYNEVKSFDDLPTPFRCVATDLNTGTEVVFSEGSLFDALRSSMSLPALFAPVHLGDKLLVDGGLLNNLPVDVVKRMGADIVIAVALDRPQENNRYTSMLGVAGRSISVMVSANERKSLGMADLVIMPRLENLGMSDYGKFAEFAKRGYEAAGMKAAMLERLQVSDEEYAAYKAERARRRAPDTVRPQIVEIQGEIAPRRKEALVDAITSDPSKPVDRPALETELTKITGMGRFDTANYSFIRRDGKEGVLVRATEKSYGPPFFRLSMLLDASRQDGFRFGIGGRLTFLDAGGPASEWRTDLSIGQINRLGTEYYYRIKGGKWFVAPRLFFWEDSLPLYVGKDRVSEFLTRQTGGAADFGYAAGRFQEWRAGYTLSHDRIAVTRGSNSFDPLKGRYSDIHFKWSYEGQDSALVPRHGLRAVVKVAAVVDHPSVDGAFLSGDATVSYARPFDKKYSLLTELSGGGSPSDAALSARYWLGGVGRMDALGRGQLIGHSYYYGGARLLRSLTSDSLMIFGRFYAFLGAESGKAWYPGVSAMPRYSSSLGLMGETAIGVVYFGAGFGDRGDRRLFFRLGRVF